MWLASLAASYMYTRLCHGLAAFVCTFKSEKGQYVLSKWWKGKQFAPCVLCVHFRKTYFKGGNESKLSIDILHFLPFCLFVKENIIKNCFKWIKLTKSNLRTAFWGQITAISTFQGRFFIGHRQWHSEAISTHQSTLKHTSKYTQVHTKVHTSTHKYTPKYTQVHTKVHTSTLWCVLVCRRV